MWSINEEKLRELGFLCPDEQVARIDEGPWKQGGQHFVMVADIHLQNGSSKKIAFKCPYDVFGEKAAQRWVERRVELARRIREAGGSVPKLEVYDRVTMVQEYIDGEFITEENRKRYQPLLDREFKIYRQLGLKYMDMHDGNFVISNGRAYCIDIDFL